MFIINEIIIKPFDEIETSEKSSLYDYTNDGIVIYLNKEQIDISYEKLNEEISDHYPILVKFDSSNE